MLSIARHGKNADFLYFYTKPSISAPCLSLQHHILLFPLDNLYSIQIRVLIFFECLFSFFKALDILFPLEISSAVLSTWRIHVTSSILLLFCIVYTINKNNYFLFSTFIEHQLYIGHFARLPNNGAPNMAHFRLNFLDGVEGTEKYTDIWQCQVCKSCVREI